MIILQLTASLLHGTITYTYDKNSNIKTISDSTGSRIEYAYDSMGRLIQEKILMEGSRYIITGYEYDKSGNLVKKWNEVDAQDLNGGGTGKVQALTTLEYDKNGNLIKVISPEGYVTTYEYDDNDRVIAVNEQVREDAITVKRNSLSVKSQKNILYPGVMYTFDIEMDTTNTVKGFEAEIRYDDRLMGVTYTTANISGLVIDTHKPGIIKLSIPNSMLNGKVNLAKITMIIKEGYSGTGYIIPSSGTWKDAKGQNSFTSLAGKFLVIKAPDMNNNGIVELGDLTLTAREDGMSQGQSGYNEAYDITGDGLINYLDLDYIKNRIFAQDTMLLNSIPTAKTDEKSVYSAYDTSSSIVTRTTTYEYDKAGNLTKETDCNGRSIQYVYDAYNRIIKVIDKEGGITRIFYDEEGNITKLINPQEYNPATDSGQGEVYTYDTMNRLIEVRDIDGTLIQKNIYNKDSLITAVYDANGKAVEYNYDLGQNY